ncbi:MAG: endonuclease III [Atribacterota bacterium]|nr:endonuclease III [Atribacterota bacterium]
MEEERVARILSILEEHFPEARLLLEFRTPFELLIATILAAQARDERVNQVTQVLFRRFQDVFSLAQAPLEEIEQIVRPLSYYRQKAQFIKETAREIVEKFKGEVPPSLEALIQLPGVGRKTANIVLGNAFHIPALPVDTHVGRVAQRLKLSFSSSPDKIEEDLGRCIPKEKWVRATHLFGFLGRFICQAKKPLCHLCPIRAFCPYPEASSLNPPRN